MADDTARIRADVERTRAELGETVTTLAEELDPRVRARRAAQGAQAQAQARLERGVAAVREDPRLAVAGVAAVLLVLWLRARRH